MKLELDKYGIQMPSFGKIGGLLANELSVDQAAGEWRLPHYYNTILLHQCYYHISLPYNMIYGSGLKKKLTVPHIVIIQEDCSWELIEITIL